MTRIIAGHARSMRLEVPKSGTRPTSDRVREAIFSALESWGMLDGTRVLDLFAGSGALGLEAASRGATHVTLVEKHAPAAAIVQRNADRVGERTGTCEIVVQRMSAATYLLGSPVGSWDVVFIDPPYDFPAAKLHEILTLVAPHLSEAGLMMVERSTRLTTPQLPETLRLIKERSYGETTLTWIEADTTN